MTLAELPQSIRRIVQVAVEQIHPKRIILFGSRATGQARENSDFDLAFVLPPSSNDAWLNFLMKIEEDPLTLRSVDLVNWDEASEDLKERITLEGIILHE